MNFSVVYIYIIALSLKVTNLALLVFVQLRKLSFALWFITQFSNEIHTSLVSRQLYVCLKKTSITHWPWSKYTKALFKLFFSGECFILYTATFVTIMK